MKFAFWFGLLLTCGILCSVGQEVAAPKSEVMPAPALGSLFTKQEVTGTFVLLNPAKGTLHIWNEARARQRFIPASTFKIPNTLIGLENGAVKNVDEVLPYGGKPQWIKEWEQDLSLRHAIKISAVPIYQELARRVGLEKMKQSVEKLGYGNRQVGDVVDRFWLDGPLQISAVEQVEFLDRLLKNDLPVKPSSVQAVKDIVTKEQVGQQTIHYKTGWGISTKPGIGWIVGWVEDGGRLLPFALNIDMAQEADGKKRLPLLKECLRSLGEM